MITKDLDAIAFTISHVWTWGELVECMQSYGVKITDKNLAFFAEHLEDQFSNVDVVEMCQFAVENMEEEV